jgi:hypothetical protein
MLRLYTTLFYCTIMKNEHVIFRAFLNVLAATCSGIESQYDLSVFNYNHDGKLDWQNQSGYYKKYYNKNTNNMR